MHVKPAAIRSLLALNAYLALGTKFSISVCHPLNVTTGAKIKVILACKCRLLKTVARLFPLPIGCTKRTLSDLCKGAGMLQYTQHKEMLCISQIQSIPPVVASAGVPSALLESEAATYQLVVKVFHTVKLSAEPYSGQNLAALTCMYEGDMPWGKFPDKESSTSSADMASLKNSPQISDSIPSFLPNDIRHNL